MASPLLVLTDFSPAADKALTYAEALAAHLDSSLVLLHVRRSSWLDPEAFTGRISHFSEGEIAAALAERAGRLRVPVRVEAAADQVVPATCQAVAQHRPLLVVVGKPDTEQTPDALVHTTSLELLRECQVPLLIVPLHGNATVPPTHLLLAADNLPLHVEPTIAALPRQLAPQARLTLTHVVEPEESDSCASAHVAVQQTGLLQGFEQIRPYGMRHLSVPEGIAQAAVETQADLLVLLARRHSVLGRLFHSSVTAASILRGTVPMLVLPAGE
ncbi:universal stress protein [Hymenobacter guriensis]|uniref:Universal stress protein n=1 Tax=Hymenobacter guriensis TaxID=2793065 RepID=A0ABS0L710_9BACT|nr:universal stress protein [Hymenobacter guriensis]MBG8555874.1 universal stress protein [Hymenobacter guriensis]